LGFLLFGFALKLPKTVLFQLHIQIRKMLPMKHPLCWTLFTCLAGCGVITPESIYEGIRSQQKINADPKIPNPQILPPYDQYQKDREKPQSMPPVNAAP
jgi:hypothetical protein